MAHVLLQDQQEESRLTCNKGYRAFRFQSEASWMNRPKVIERERDTGRAQSRAFKIEPRSWQHHRRRSLAGVSYGKRCKREAWCEAEQRDEQQQQSDEQQIISTHEFKVYTE